MLLLSELIKAFRFLTQFQMNVNSSHPLHHHSRNKVTSSTQPMPRELWVKRLSPCYPLLKFIQVLVELYCFNSFYVSSSIIIHVSSLKRLRIVSVCFAVQLMSLFYCSFFSKFFFSTFVFVGIKRKSTKNEKEKITKIMCILSISTLGWP